MTAAPEISPVQRRFFDAAMEILAEEGYGALKLAALCKRVGVTSGSFYHAFDGWQRFTDAFLAHWFEERTMRIVELTDTVASAQEQVDLLLDVSLRLPHASESAIRVWAGVDPEVRKLQDEVDRLRLETVTRAFTGVMGDEEAARKLAGAALYMLVGYEQAAGARDREALETGLNLLPVYAQRFADRNA
ncbi:TetR/AcrR family transcriptional regulator [Aeromicrobium sp. Leaf350]|uniref:TetR/AcrR family transcriptional regulator n=1 Tax=Aeromicrobium sp. Leaf350 TaxID=2876565 RepID=UPI001E5A0B35|nr:TetR/AcrR family transcriptional regulator [Aeromicrobium sp. Leaf350]